MLMGMVEAALTVSGWTPAKSIGTLLAWYKSDTQAYNTGTTQATNGQTVDQWKDQSGNSVDLAQATEGNKFTFTTGVLNGYPGLLNVRANQNYMRSPSVTWSQPFMAFFALKTSAAWNVADGYEDIWDNTTISGSRPVIFVNIADGTNQVGIYAGTYAKNATTLSASTGYYITGVFNGASSVTNVNGSAGTPADAGSAGYSAAAWDIGPSAGGADAYFIEQFWISGSSVTDISNAETYLKNKYGL